MHRKDDILLAEAYKQTKQIDEGLLGRTSARLAGLKGSVGGIRDKITGVGQVLKGAGQLATGNREGLKTASAGLNKFDNAKNVSLNAKIDSLVNSKSKDLVDDLNKLGINSKDSPLNSDELSTKLKEVLLGKGIGTNLAPTAKEETPVAVVDEPVTTVADELKPETTPTDVNTKVTLSPEDEKTVKELADEIRAKSGIPISADAAYLAAKKDLGLESNSFRAYFKSKFII